MNAQLVPIGTRIRFRISGQPIQGRVVEDRGPIGIGGRHLYTVRYEAGKGNWHSTELPAEVMENVDSKPVNRRRLRELSYLFPVEALEAHSLFVKAKHSDSLADFLRSRDVRFTREPEAIEGEVLFLIDKGIPWDEFIDSLEEWRQRYAEE